MPKKFTVPPEDLAIFHQVMKGTRLLKNKKIRLAPKQNSRSKLKDTDDETRSFSFKETQSLTPVLAESQLSYQRAGISDKILRKLRKGQYNIEAMLDLHGMSVSKAEAAISQFLQHCLYEHYRVVLIIHGKGHFKKDTAPVLKNKLNHWLRHFQAVLAFCSASRLHGGSGALYILLKRHEDTRGE